jgi:asparagine synthase (glutamine-hydrolysing)
MCGIAGVVVPQGRTPPREAVARMVSALQHRGPDDEGVDVVDGVALGHRRLSILDRSAAGHQPMASPDGAWWLTYNGEAFNHVELRQELPPVAWRGGSDTETVLHGLATHGTAFVERLNGLFAFAALDRPGRRLLLVRDRFGVKPLYYARTGGALWFASEIGALLAAGVPREPRADVLAHAVDRGWANGAATPIADVCSVLPGTWLEVDLDTLACREHRWYSPADVVDDGRMATLTTAAPEEVERLVAVELRSAVRRRLLSDVPVGTMLSGGIDSSLITAFAAEQTETVHAFTASIADQPGADESSYSREVAEHLGVCLHVVPMDAVSWRRDFVDVVHHLESPMLHESSVPMAHIAELARSQGVPVLLSGEGADELFGGYGWRHDVLWRDFSRGRGARERAVREAVRAVHRRRRGVPWPDMRTGTGLSASVRAHETAVVQDAQRAYARAPGLERALAAALLADLGLYLPHLLNRQDRTTMRAGVETRVPFLDPDLVALALNLPLAARVEPYRKAPLRALARRLLPPTVTARPKVGFGFDVTGYLAAQRPEFLARGVLREVLQVSGDAWSAVLPSLGGRHPMLLTSGEVWARLFLRGDDVGEVSEALWGPA